jgi:hypothetical protein
MRFDLLSLEAVPRGTEQELARCDADADTWTVHRSCLTTKRERVELVAVEEAERARRWSPSSLRTRAGSCYGD